MSEIQEKNLDALLLGTGEFSFSEDATSEADAATRGYRDLGNVKAFSLQPESSPLEHEGSYRGIKRVDRRKITKIKHGYLLTVDEFKDLVMWLAFFGAAGAGFTQTAAATANGDALPFGTTAAVIGLWYDLRIAGARVRNITTVTITGKAEGTDFILDKLTGRIRFLTAQAANLVPVITAPQITSASVEYLKTLTPLTKTTRSGFGRLAVFDENSPAVVFEHTGFSCDIALEGQPNIDGDNFSDLQIKVQITGTVGTVLHRE